MSTTIRQTLIGMTEHYPTLFDSLELPDGYNKEDFIDSLLLEHGEKGIIYSNPVFFASAIGVWGRKWYHELERIQLALYEEYNPLHNFDRNEVYTDERTGGKNTAHDFVGMGTNNETYTKTSDEVYNHDRKSDAETEEQTSAFNSSDYEPSTKTTNSGDEWRDTRSGGNYTDNHATTSRDSGTESTVENDNTKHTGHLYGNIGITESTTMLAHEVETRMKYNLYEIASRMFANEFLINIY